MSINKEINGFSLIELMIVVAIVGILSALAAPSWIEYSYKGRRADAVSSLLNVQLFQEKWRANDTDYATLAELGWVSGSGNSTDGYYTISISSSSVSSFIASAAPVGKQAGDHCGSFVISQNGPDYTSGADADCWGH